RLIRLQLAFIGKGVRQRFAGFPTSPLLHVGRRVAHGWNYGGLGTASSDPPRTVYSRFWSGVRRRCSVHIMGETTRRLSGGRKAIKRAGRLDSGYSDWT